MATHTRAPHDRPRLCGAGATVGCHVLPTGAVSDAVRLRTHLILLTLATVVPVVLFAVGLIIYYMWLERLSFECGMRDMARVFALVLDCDVNDIKTGVETLAGSQYLDGRVDLAHFYEEAATISKGLGAWAVLSDPSG